MREVYIAELVDKVLTGEDLGVEEAKFLAGCKGNELINLYYGANKLREHFHGNKADLCSVLNSKSGSCPEDCGFCAQSARHETFIDEYPLMPVEQVLDVAGDVYKKGARRFCISASGKGLSIPEVEKVCTMVREIKKRLPLYCCGTLGDLEPEAFQMLKEAGLDRYHHNIETSKRFFPKICTTHTYQERLETIRHARNAGLSTCVGVILGMGEGVEDWIDMAISIREIDPDSIPLNFLMPVMGTRLENTEPLMPGEALKAISIFRFLSPSKEIRICGGRLTTLQDMHPLLFMAGADGIMIGNYLTKTGRDPKDDIKLIKQLNMDVEEVMF